MGMTHKLTIVGCGPGDKSLLTAEASRHIAEAEILVGSRRLLAMFPESGAQRLPWMGAKDYFLDALSALFVEDRKIVVLAGGDPGVFSLARLLVKRFGKRNCLLVPGVSSVQLAFARLGEPWAGALILDAHGRVPDVSLEEMRRNGRVAAVLDAGRGWEWMLAAARGLAGGHDLYLCSNLSLPDEEVRLVGDVNGLAASRPPELAVAVWLSPEDSEWARENCTE